MIENGNQKMLSEDAQREVREALGDLRTPPPAPFEVAHAMEVGKFYGVTGPGQKERWGPTPRTDAFVAGVPSHQCLEDRYAAMWGFAGDLEREWAKDRDRLVELAHKLADAEIARGEPERARHQAHGDESRTCATETTAIPRTEGK